jgi:hypothetical protein
MPSIAMRDAADGGDIRSPLGSVETE